MRFDGTLVQFWQTPSESSDFRYVVCEPYHNFKWVHIITCSKGKWLKCQISRVGYIPTCSYAHANERNIEKGSKLTNVQLLTQSTYIEGFRVSSKIVLTCGPKWSHGCLFPRIPCLWLHHMRYWTILQGRKHSKSQWPQVSERKAPP